ncbi:MAG: hypothetical protein FWC47_16580, partial [Oscillospiraceae bacterium]|nr:hypothetical protein [Oscillospiraceae bacterium]
GYTSSSPNYTQTPNPPKVDPYVEYAKTRIAEQEALKQKCANISTLKKLIDPDYSLYINKGESQTALDFLNDEMILHGGQINLRSLDNSKAEDAAILGAISKLTQIHGGAVYNQDIATLINENKDYGNYDIYNMQTQDMLEEKAKKIQADVDKGSNWWNIFSPSFTEKNLAEINADKNLIQNLIFAGLIGSTATPSEVQAVELEAQLEAEAATAAESESAAVTAVEAESEAVSTTGTGSTAAMATESESTATKTTGSGSTTATTSTISTNRYPTTKITSTDKEGYLIDKVTDARSQLIQNRLKTGGNAAYAEVNVDAIDQTDFYAHSRIFDLGQIKSEPGAEVFLPNGLYEGSTFEATMAPNSEGDPYLRNVDSEFKLINDIANQLGDNTEATGTINLFTEMDTCDSCNNVIQQFTKKYKNINVNVFYRDDLK